MNDALPSLDMLKQQARRLRDALRDAAGGISHSRSLELVARQHGFRNWNALRANAGAETHKASPVGVGERVKGRYLGKPFTGRVVGVHLLAKGWTQVSIDLDAPVDVVDFESFSAFRRRITATLMQNGRTAKKTSDGVPHLALDLEARAGVTA